MSRKSSTYKCHVPRCPGRIEGWQVMCWKHWRDVPKDIQSRVWHEYRLKAKGLGSPDWSSVIRLAILFAMGRPSKMKDPAGIEGGPR